VPQLFLRDASTERNHWRLRVLVRKISEQTWGGAQLLCFGAVGVDSNSSGNDRRTKQCGHKRHGGRGRCVLYTRLVLLA